MGLPQTNLLTRNWNWWKKKYMIKNGQHTRTIKTYIILVIKIHEKIKWGFDGDPNVKQVYTVANKVNTDSKLVCYTGNTIGDTHTEPLTREAQCKLRKVSADWEAQSSIYRLLRRFLLRQIRFNTVVGKLFYICRLNIN